MKYNDLQITKNRSPKRVGRGIAAGQGKTAGRGTKGQMSRTGSHKRPGFEGGQNPLMQRLPKLHGFRGLRIDAEEVYTGDLNQFSAKTVDSYTLSEAGLISSPFVRVKLLVRGELTSKVTVKLDGASAGAIEVIKKAGGSFEKVARTAAPASAKKLEKKEKKEQEKESTKAKA
jgi:large subunit ribosomal protein L15